MVAARRRADGARALRRRPLREGGAPRARTPAGARARRGRPGPQLAGALRRAAARLEAGAARRDGRRRRAPGGPPRPPRPRRHLRPRLLQEQGQAPLAGLVLRAAARRPRGARSSSRRPSSTTAAAACSRAGRATRSSGRWRAATPAPSGGVANALWVWLPLCALFVLPFARPPWRLLHLDLAVLLAFSVSYAFFNASRIDVSVPLVYPLLAYLLARMLGIAFARARGREPPPLRLTVPVGRARDRGGLHPRLPHRAQRHRLERDRRRLRERDRRRPLRRRRAGLRRLPARQPARRHLRPGPLLRLRPVRGAAAVERDVGRPARRPRRGGDVRPADRGGAVAARPPPARAGPRRAARLRVGDVPVHAAGGQLERQRRARRAARHRRDARARRGPAARGARAWPRPR